MLRDLGHPAADGAQAVRHHLTRTSRPVSAPRTCSGWPTITAIGARHRRPLRAGPWMVTYGVGDHMSHYNVNASVPKTLIRFLLRWAIGADLFGEAANEVLTRSRHRHFARVGPRRRGDKTAPTRTPSRPSAPTSSRTSSCITSCASAIGPARSRPRRACLGRPQPRRVADLIPVEKRTSTRWPRSATGWRSSSRRFFQTSQFKRSAMPNAPKVGSGGSLSPRSDWRAPSDGDAAAWLQELRDGVPAMKTRSESPVKHRPVEHPVNPYAPRFRSTHPRRSRPPRLRPGRSRRQRRRIGDFDAPLRTPTSRSARLTTSRNASAPCSQSSTRRANGSLSMAGAVTVYLRFRPGEQGASPASCCASPLKPSGRATRLTSWSTGWPTATSSCSPRPSCRGRHAAAVSPLQSCHRGQPPAVMPPRSARGGDAAAVRPGGPVRGSGRSSGGVADRRAGLDRQ